METTALLVSPTAAPGGSERALVGLARQLPDFGIRPTAVLLSDGPLRTWLERVGCRVILFDAGRARQIPLLVSTVRRLVGLARGADIVVSNQTKGHIYGGLAAKVAGVPEVWWQHGMAGRSPIDLMARIVPSNVVVCNSLGTAYCQRRLTPRLRLEVIYPGSAINLIRQCRGSGTKIRSEYGWTGHPVVGIVGRLQPWKGQEVFLRAAALVAEAYQDARFAVIGGAVLGWEGDYPETLRVLAEELGIGRSTVFAGHQDDVFPWFDLLDIVVHASFDEPFGLVLVEAMALGKPLIATSGPGPSEILEDGVSGILVPPGDERQLSCAIERLLGDTMLAQSLGEAAASRALAFSERTMGERFASLLRDLSVNGSAQPIRRILSGKGRIFRADSALFVRGTVI